MVSGQLEDSLRHEIESYIEGRLGGIKHEIAALQSQLNESLSRFLDRQAGVRWIVVCPLRFWNTCARPTSRGSN